MTMTIRALQFRPRAFIHLKPPACVFRSNNHGHLNKPLQARLLQRNLTTPSTQESFHRVPETTIIEEELLPGYKAEDYYPVRIDEILNSRYRVICKLGSGVGSTVWLAKDMRTCRYLAVKVSTRTRGGVVTAQVSQEIAVAKYLKTAPVQEHPGRRDVRIALDSFTLKGPHGAHTCLVYAPQGMTLTELREYLPNNRLPKRVLQTSIQILLIAMDYLHKNGVVHTDISPNNILVGALDDTPFSQLEKDEQERPIARKVLTDRTLYMSRPVPRTNGQPVLSDMGSARFGRETFTGDIMPDVYRAPEVILGMEWSSKVDLWSVGVMIWDLLEGKNLFHARKDGVLDDEQHLAEMVSLMGNPPRELLRRNEICARFFDDAGNWKGSIPIPEQSLEDRISQVQGEDKELLLRFARRLLCWLPEERPTAEEMAYDDFLMEAYFAANSKG